MATDFFAQQDVARRKTTRLVVYFVLAVLGILIAVDLAVIAIVDATTARTVTHGVGEATPSIPIELLAGTTAVTLAIIVFGSLYKIAQLRGGGRAVATALGGRPIPPDAADPACRRILNVVEEMAIASGTPVPPVYLLPREDGINAFAAGTTPGDAVIGVTRGTVRHLSRAELQGVVAHEFSHVLNGDMRLNLRLIGVLHGILLLGALGYYLLRIGAYSGGGRSREGKGAGALILALGVSLLVIGSIGVFFSKLIKSAVSRQREYLADASAVQFTRNPTGIGGALKKIGGLAEGSLVASPAAEETSHLFFGGAVRSLLGLFATHPPLADRIRRIDPSFDGTFPPVHSEGIALEEPTAEPTVTRARARAGVRFGRGAGAAGLRPGGAAGRVAAARLPLDVSDALSQIGLPGMAHVAFAAGLLASLPEGLRSAAREPFGARAIVHALLLDEDDTVRERQLRHLEAEAERGTAEETRRLHASVRRLPEEARLPLVDLTLPALQQLSPAQQDRFRRNVDALVRADARTTLFEFALTRVVLRHLERATRDPRPTPIRHTTIPAVLPAIGDLLSTLAHEGQADEPAARRAFDAGQRELLVPTGGIAMRARAEASLEKLDSALETLDAATPAIKKRVLVAAATCIAHDGNVTPAEGELLRAVADSLDCPMPPLLVRDVQHDAAKDAAPKGPA